MQQQQQLLPLLPCMLCLRLQPAAVVMHTHMPPHSQRPPPPAVPLCLFHVHRQIESEFRCQTGLEEEAELHWKQDQRAALEPCQNIKHTFARIARECTDVRFLSINVSCTQCSPTAACAPLAVWRSTCSQLRTTALKMHGRARRSLALCLGSSAVVCWRLLQETPSMCVSPSLYSLFSLLFFRSLLHAG